MQHQAAQDVVGEGPLGTHALELAAVLWVCLDAQAGREHELADRDAEAGEEGVEGLMR